jgi:hypothetical protein
VESRITLTRTRTVVEIVIIWHDGDVYGDKRQILLKIQNKGITIASTTVASIIANKGITYFIKNQ